MNTRKKEVISIIKILAITLDEAVINMKIDDEYSFETIEWRKSENKIILHQTKFNVDYEYDYELLDENIQDIVYYNLVRTYLI